MSQDNKKSFVMYQGDGSNNVFSVPMTKGKYGTISVAFVRRGLDQYEYNPNTWGLNGGLFAWDLSGTKVYTDTATPAIGATIYDQYGVDTGDTVTAVGGATITVNTNVYTRDTLHDVDENTVLTWTGDTLQIGDYIVIERTTTRTQPFEFQNNQKHIEKSDDNLERQIQEVADKVDNALLVDPTHTIDSNKMNPVEWMKTILRSVDKSVRGFRFLNGWLDYSLDDPNIADADKTWAHLLNTDNIKSVRERKEIEDGEEHRWVEYLDQNGQWQILVDSNWNARIEEVERIAGEAKQIADEAKGVADEAKEIAEGIDGKAQQALDNSVEAVETAEEAKNMIQNQIIVRSATMPTPRADLLGKNYQYAGTTNAQYTHNYIYECQTVENNTLAFTPDTVSCSWNNLSAFLSQQTPDYNSVVKGTLTYIDGGDLWRLVAMDAEDNVVLSYQQYTGDWEGVGFTFAGTYEDGAVVSFERTTTTSYVWVRVNVQPDYTAEIQELETDVDNIQAVIPEQATPTNQLVTQNTTTQIQQQVNHLQTIGRFLSFWDATTGLAQTNPQTSPYIYQTGDYFRVGVVASGGGTNYKPSGSSYTIGVASTVVETEPLTEGQVYYYDGANWALAAGGNVAIDGTTIVFNSNNELQAVATVNQNTAAGATNPVYDWVGTLAEYQAQNIETLHPDWICYITDDVSGGDSVYTKAQVDEKFQEKATAVNDNNITNCLTHIPQDIKLELNNGTLTLKAGSKVYVPNGAGVFDEVVIASDLALNGFGTGTRQMIVCYRNNQLDADPNSFSGTSTPSGSGFFYNTSTNKIDYVSSGTAWGRTYSFPLCIVTLVDSAISSIDQVFNGFGYIGSTAFALPGVKGLIPNGRNEDGTLKNIEVTVNNVLTHTGSYNDHPQWVVIYSDSISAWDSVDWMGYNSQENILFNKEGSSSATSGSKIVACVGAFLSADANQKVVAFTPKQVFHAVDNNEILFRLYPVGSLYFGTQDTCPMALLMPGTLWSRVAKKIVVVTPYDTPIPVTTSSTDTLSGAHEPLHMKIAQNGNNPSKNLLAVYGDKSVYGVGGTVAEPGSRMYPSNLQVDVSNSAVTTNVWRRDA